MTDVFTVEKRSEIMAAIKSRGTKPELALAAAVKALVGWRRVREHETSLPGKPDLWFPKTRIAVFMDGDMWHRCPVHVKPVKSDPDGFWAEKFERNVERDRRQELALLEDGIIPVRVWECEVKRRPASVAGEIASLDSAVLEGQATLSRLSYAAGILDGEGTITIANSGGKPTPWLAVGMKDRAALDELALLYGFGSVRAWSSERDLWRWRTAGAKRVAAALRWTKCMLIAKREHAELVTVFSSTVQTESARIRVSEAAAAERAQILTRVRELNALRRPKR